MRSQLRFRSSSNTKHNKQQHLAQLGKWEIKSEERPLSSSTKRRIPSKQSDWESLEMATDLATRSRVFPGEIMVVRQIWRITQEAKAQPQNHTHQPKKPKLNPKTLITQSEIRSEFAHHDPTVARINNRLREEAWFERIRRTLKPEGVEMGKKLRVLVLRRRGGEEWGSQRGVGIRFYAVMPPRRERG